MDRLPDGLVVVGKRGCPTCVLIEPVLARLAARFGNLKLAARQEAMDEIARDRSVRVVVIAAAGRQPRLAGWLGTS